MYNCFCSNSQLEEHTLHLNNYKTSIRPPNKFALTPLILPSGKFQLSYLNTSNYPFRISIDALGISYNADSQTNRKINFLHEGNDVSTAIRIFCPSGLCNGEAVLRKYKKT